MTRQLLAVAAVLTSLTLLGCDSPTVDVDAGAPADAWRLDGAEIVDASAPADAPPPRPDAGPMPCDTPGAMRTAACGNCGIESQTCTDGLWRSMGPCIGEGECRAASLETRTTPTCGEEARICNDSCVWSPWDETAPTMGECMVDERRVVADACSPGVGAVEVCSASCAWEATGECEDPCGGTARTAPDWAQEICIPAGPFIRGSTEAVASSPVAEVMMSAFYIDRYPVTNRRYATCVAAGACTEPVDSYGLASYRDAPRVDVPVAGVTWHQAVEFCAWDGGRVLPTEAQWEKSARGPSPRTVRFPWGDEEDCARVYNVDCGAPWPIPARRLEDDYDAFPMSASYYGVQMLIDGAGNWTADWYSNSYYADPSSRADPAGPPTGTSRAYRGSVRAALWIHQPVAARSPGTPTTSTWGIGFRCARPATP